MILSIDAAALRPSTQTNAASFVELQFQCVADADYRAVCETAVASWITTRCIDDPRWRAFCYGVGEPPVALSELQAARHVFDFLRLAAHRDRTVLTAEQQQLVESCLCMGNETVEAHLELWASRAVNLGESSTLTDGPRSFS